MSAVILNIFYLWESQVPENKENKESKEHLHLFQDCPTKFHIYSAFSLFFLFLFLFFSFSVMTNDVTWHHMTAMSSPYSSSMLIHYLSIISPLSFLRFHFALLRTASCLPYLYCSLSLWTYPSPLYVVPLFSPYGRFYSSLYCSFYGLMSCRLFWDIPLCFYLYKPM